MSGVLHILDGRLAELVDPAAGFELLGRGYASTEGPVWVPDGQYLLFSVVAG